MVNPGSGDCHDPADAIYRADRADRTNCRHANHPDSKKVAAPSENNATHNSKVHNHSGAENHVEKCGDLRADHDAVENGVYSRNSAPNGAVLHAEYAAMPIARPHTHYL